MKPKVICHMMSSVDGRLHPERYTLPFDGKTLNDVGNVYYDVSTAFGAQAIIIGRTTFQTGYHAGEYNHSGFTPASDFTPFVADQGNARKIVVLDSNGRINFSQNHADGEPILAVLSHRVTDEYLAYLRDMNISYTFAGRDGRDLEAMLESLHNDFDMDLVLLEGGAIINGSFLKGGLIDELSLLVYPGIDGVTGISTIFEYAAVEGELPARGQSIELKECEAMENGVVRLHYKFHKTKI